MAKRLTPAEIDRLVTLRLRGVPVREVAKLIGVQTKTVVAQYKKYLDESRAERAAELDVVREEQIQQLERNAKDARDAMERALNDDKEALVATFLTVEQRALAQIAKLTGSDAPVKAEITGEVKFPEVLRIVEEVIPGAL